MREKRDAQPGRLAVGILLFFAYLLPCGATFNAIHQGPNAFSTPADAWWYFGKVLAISLGLIMLAHGAPKWSYRARRSVPWIVLGAVALLGTLRLGACGLSADKETASRAVDAFHQRFNESRFKEVYLAATPDLKASVTEAEFLQGMHVIRGKVGAFKSSTLEEWKINFSVDGKAGELTFQSNFEQGPAAETFSFFISGDVATLDSYNINLPVPLITK